MMSSIVRYLLPLILLAAAVTASAQTDTLRPDTVRSDRAGRADSARPAPPAPAPPEEKMSRSPLTATLFGIIPGGGQIYNGDYLRAAAFAGACGAFLGRAIYYHSLFRGKAAEVDALEPDDSRITRLKFQREAYRDTRDLNFAIYLGVHILSLVDAYVGAYLYDFDVDDDISSKVIVDPIGQQVTLTLRW
jgi:hypothetical protein